MYLAGMMKRHSQKSKNKKDASISSACKLQRLSSGRPGQPALVITEETLLTMRNQGLTRTKMAEALSVSDSTIKRRLKDFNISLRKTDSKEGMNGSGSDTGMSLFGEVQGVLKIGKARGVQAMTPLCAFSDVATRQSEVTCANSGQSVPSEVAAVSSRSPVTPCFQGQGRKRKHYRITTADFKRITTDDIRGEDYPDVDMVQKITVAKCLIPDDLSAPAQALDSTQSAGEYDYEKQSYVDGGQHAIAPWGAKVKEGGVIVAECGAEEGYDHAQSSHSEVDASISVPSKTSGAKVSELKDILDTSLGQIALSFTELIPELHEEMQQMECLPPGELQALKDSFFNSLENPVSCSEKGQAMADVGLPNGDQKHSICLADLGLNLELGNADTRVFSPKSEVFINMMALNIHPQTETPKPLTAPDSGASPMKGGGEARSGGVLDCYMFEQEAAASTAVVSATVTAELPLFPPQQPGAVKGPGIVSQGMWVSEDSRPVVQNSFPDDSDLENGGMALLVNFQPQEHGQFSFKGKTIQVSVELGQGGAVAGPILGHSPSQTEYGTRNESEFSELIKLLEESGSQPLITDLEGQQSIEREGQVFGVAEGASQFVKMLPGQVGQQKETCQLQGFDVAGGASQVLETPSGQVDQQGQGVAGQRMRNEQLVSFTPGQLGHGLGPGSDFLMQNEYVAADQLNGSAQFQESWQGQGVLEVGGASQMIYSGQGQIDQQMPERGGVWTELYEIRGAGQIMDGVAGQKLPGQIILGPDEMGWINQSIGGGPDGKQGQGVVLPGVDKMGGAGQSAGGGPVGQQIPVQVILGQGGVLPGVDELVGAGQSAAGGQQIPGQMTFDEPGQMIFDEPGQMIFDEPGRKEGGNVPNFDMIVD